MITRYSRYDIFKKLKSSPELKVIDLGCGSAGACPYADVLVDMNDWSANFPDKKFIVHDLNKFPLPFGDLLLTFQYYYLKRINLLQPNIRLGACCHQIFYEFVWRFPL